MENKLRKRLLIVMFGGIIVLSMLILLMVIINNKKDNTIKQDDYTIVENQPDINYTEIENPVEQQDEDNSEDSSDSYEEVIEPMSDDFDVSSATKTWLFSNTLHGIELVENSNEVILSEFNNGEMFKNFTIEGFNSSSSGIWWIAIDKSNADNYFLYVSYYDYINSDATKYVYSFAERTGTKPVKLSITNKDIIEKIDWCIDNFPKESGYIDSNLRNAQYLLCVRDTPIDQLFNVNNNLANTVHGNSWAGISMYSLTDKFIKN